MICPNCGAENAQGAPYCYNCANPLPQTGAMPPGSVPPGSVPPGSVPPGPGQTAQFPQQTGPGPVPPASMPPASPPPGGTPPPQWPTGGGYEPPKPPKSTISAGVGGLIAFLVVAGIGAILFFTVFNKKDKAEPVPPTPPTPTVSVPATSAPGPTTAPTTPATTGATTPATTAATTGATTAPTTAATTAPTTGPTTAAVTGPSGPTGPKGGGKPSFEPFFCRKAPTSNTFGNGCARHLTVSPTTVNFAFVIRTQNIPAGVGFAVTFFDKGNQAVGSFDMPKTTPDRINRLILSITLNQIAAGQEFVAVITADGQATTCAGHVCSRNELASISFG